MFIISGILVLFGLIIGLPVDITNPNITELGKIRFAFGYTMFIVGCLVAFIGALRKT